MLRCEGARETLGVARCSIGLGGSGAVTPPQKERRELSTGLDSESQMIDLVRRFQETLDARRDILECFCNYGVQVEGWLKGEFLYFLDAEKARGRLYYVDREVSFGQGGRRIDIKITGESGVATWVELKHWLIGKQKGERYSAGFYLRDSSSAGIKPDVEKLKLTSGTKFMLILATANPGAKDWFRGVEAFNRKFSPLRISPKTDPADFHRQYFLGLLAAE